MAEHNAGQIWAWEDDEVVFEAACECGWYGPDRSDQAEAIADATAHSANGRATTTGDTSHGAR